MAAAEVIRAEELFAGYGKNIVLRDVTLTIETGSLAGIYGPNGAGKSTFVKLCLGMLRPVRGRLSVLGGSPWGAGGRRFRLRTGYVPQKTSGGNLPLSVRDSVSMGLYGKLGFFRPLSGRDRLAVEQAMEACGISQLADRLVRELSGGQAQRAAIARALVPDAELLLLDEPTSSLDAEGRTELLRIIKERREYRHITALIVSHDEAALGECGAVYRFDEGRVTKTYA
ncbi:MAG: metal ABC transporter ATP-binding protein [Spirochaetaceae bacterium]|jgi:ABC-type Mn2+/Zn2+ transport system ATPase subunit|nr:metal ABC transporter ATP-binding protein [Spirochaetaceae bacterium]